MSFCLTWLDDGPTLMAELTTSAHLSLSVAAIATHFNLVPDTIELYAQKSFIKFPCHAGRVCVPQVLAGLGCGALFRVEVHGAQVSDNSDIDVTADDTGTHTEKPTWQSLQYEYANHKDMERYVYLCTGRVPTRVSDNKSTAAVWKRNCNQRYFLREHDGRLVFKTQTTHTYVSLKNRTTASTHPTKLVLFNDDEMRDVVRTRHARGHDRTTRMVSIMSDHYKFPNMRNAIETILGKCQVCAEMTAGLPEPKQAIMSTNKNELIMFDLFSVGYESEDGNHHVLLIKDHFSHYLAHKVFPTKEAAPIAAFLFDYFSGDRPCPERWHCDNGSEFVNKIMHAVIDKLQPKYTHGRPRHPETQGSIERANGTIAFCVCLSHLRTCGMHSRNRCHTYDIGCMAPITGMHTNYAYLGTMIQ